MPYRPGDIVWYHGPFSRQEEQALVRGVFLPSLPTADTTYLITLLSGSETGQTSVVYEADLRPKYILDRRRKAAS